MTEAVQLLILDRKSARLRRKRRAALARKSGKKAAGGNTSSPRPGFPPRSRRRASARPMGTTDRAAENRVFRTIRRRPVGPRAAASGRNIPLRRPSAGPATLDRRSGDGGNRKSCGRRAHRLVRFSCSPALRTLLRCRALWNYTIGRRPFQFDPVRRRRRRFPARILQSTPTSAVHASEDFAAVLCAGPSAGRPRVEYIGDCPRTAEKITCACFP